MSRYFHGTSRAAARAILSEGWRDGRGKYLTDTEHTGVWLSDRPNDQEMAAMDGILLVVEVPALLVEPPEWIEEGKEYREFLVPAALLNSHGTVAIADEQ
jgi:hypothetical protein